MPSSTNSKTPKCDIYFEKYRKKAGKERAKWIDIQNGINALKWLKKMIEKGHCQINWLQTSMFF